MMTMARTTYPVTEDRRDEKRRKVVELLNMFIKQADEKEKQLLEKGLKYDAYNYRVLKYILYDIRNYVKHNVKVNSKNTYILPGAIWISKSLLSGRITVDDAANIIGGVRYLSTRLFRELVYKKNLTLIIPSNLNPKDVNVYLWTDKVGYDRDGNPLYMLTMYFSFPFDISELDRRSEYEPVSVLFVKKGNEYVPIKAYARVHYDIYVYDLEKLDNMEILFMRLGHTPKILGKEAFRASSSNILKEMLDKAWLVIGDFITRLTGVNRIRIKDEKEKIHVYINYRLPKTKNNVFETAVHPYFVDISLNI